MQLRLLVGYRRFGEAYQSIFKDQAVQEEYSLDYLTFPNGMIGCPETSVPKYQPTLCNIQKEGRLQLHHGGSLKSRLIWYIVVRDGLRKNHKILSQVSRWHGGDSKQAPPEYNYTNPFSDKEIVITITIMVTKCFINNTWDESWLNPLRTADGHQNRGNGDRRWVVAVRNRSEKETDALYSSEHTSYIKRSRGRGTRNYYLIEKYLYTSAPPFSEGTLQRLRFVGFRRSQLPRLYPMA